MPTDAPADRGLDAGLREALGHTDIAHAELYTRAADQERLARDGMGHVVRLFGEGKIKPMQRVARFGKAICK